MIKTYDSKKIANKNKAREEETMAKKRLTRRQFLKDIGITCACSDLLFHAITSNTAMANDAQTEIINPLPSMEHRTLGKTGLKVSALGFGVMRLTDPTVLYKALELGVNYFDTAHAYQNGNNEMMLGNVLKEYGRNKVFIATKIHPYQKRLGDTSLQDPGTMGKVMDESLQRLQTDYVDVLLLHGVKDAECPVNEDIMTFLDKQKKAGKARFVGLSVHIEGNLYVEIINQALRSGFYDVFLARHNFKSPSEHIKALAFARSKQVGIISMKTQAGGYKKGLMGDFNPHQAALKWVLDQNFVDCAIPGMVNRDQLLQNMAVVGKKPTSADRKALDAYYISIKDRYCVNCGVCAPTCERNVDVPSIHRSLMYAEGYGDLDLARATYRELPSQDNATACMNCHNPTCNCINGIKIEKRMRYAHTIFA